MVSLLRKWVDEGAISPDDEEIPDDPTRYWSYQTPKCPSVPEVKNVDWVRNPIDAFIAREHQRKGLTHSAEASREIWLRRIYLDLIGLPPTRTELRAFLDDQSAGAYESVVDSLSTHA